MNKQKITLQFGIVAVMVLIAAISRLVPHWPNFTAVGAMGLFGAAYFTKKYWAFIIPFIALWFSDLVLNNVVYAQYYDSFVWMTPSWYWMYGSFALIILIGFLSLSKVTPARIVGASFTAAFLFFLITNFGVWMSGLMYPKTAAGLLACYTAGLPYLGYTLAGNLFYTLVLFGSYELLAKPYLFSSLEEMTAIDARPIDKF